MSIPVMSLPLGNIHDEAMLSIKPGDIKTSASTVYEITEVDEEGNYYGFKIDSINEA